MLLALRDIVTADLELPVRAGVNRGPVFKGHLGTAHRRTLTVLGDTVNLAARVTGKAPMRGILCTRPVIERSRTLFEETDVEPFMVKGKRHPVVASIVGPPRGQRSEIASHERWVRLAGGDEVTLGPDVELDRPGLEPRPAAGRHRRRLRHLDQSEHTDVEGPGLVLRPDRDRQLHVVDRHPARGSIGHSGCRAVRRLRGHQLVL